MLRRLFPHPMLSVTLFVTWMLLVNQFKIGSLVMAAILAAVIPLIDFGSSEDAKRGGEACRTLSQRIKTRPALSAPAPAAGRVG